MGSRDHAELRALVAEASALITAVTLLADAKNPNGAAVAAVARCAQSAVLAVDAVLERPRD